jgi:twitching motility protein PilT
MVARVISDKMPNLEEIGMPKIIYDLLNLKQGLILITGPTGCGKSTSLAAMINYINLNRRCHIITLEDPIEYLFKPEKSIIIQRQLGTDMLSFSEGLKHALRQDPNVIMVGEMRDLETIATTITLAETGHLVLATLHTYNAAQTIDRIIDIFPPHQQGQVRMQLSMTLAAVMSQRLLNKTEGGRVAAREVMLNTAAVSNLIRENKVSQLKTVIETSSKEGMISLDQDLQRMFKEKLITKEIAQSHMTNPDLLDKFKIL